MGALSFLLILLFVAGLAAGFVLFRPHTLRLAVEAGSGGGLGRIGQPAVSVIIPARNEAANLPVLLASLQAQTRQPEEIIVVDDGSTGGTRGIAESFGVTVLAGTEPPSGWTGKDWAVWNGYRQSSGGRLVFLDAAVRLAPGFGDPDAGPGSQRRRGALGHSLSGCIRIRRTAHDHGHAAAPDLSGPSRLRSHLPLDRSGQFRIEDPQASPGLDSCDREALP